jgi:hypothetical protein
MKIPLIIVCCLFSLFCVGQEQTNLRFVSKKDSSKKYIAHLPQMADITTLNKKHIHTVVVDANDSILTVLKHIHHKKDTNGHDTLMMRYNGEEYKIQNNKLLSESEKESQSFQLEKSLFFKDTMRIKVDTLQKIKFTIPGRSKIARACALGICAASSFLFIDELVTSASDSATDPNKHKSTAYAWLGLGGMIGGTIWYAHVNHKVIYFKEWAIKNSGK